MNEIELRNIMYTAQLGLNNPLAIRYPRGRGTIMDWKQKFERLKIGEGEQITDGTEVAVLSVGTVGENIKNIVKKFPKGLLAQYNMRFVKPLDENLLQVIFKKFHKIITVEEGTKIGGFGSAINDFYFHNSFKNKIIKNIGISDKFITHGTMKELNEIVGLDEKSLAECISKILKKKV